MCRGLDGLIVDSVVPVTAGLTDEFALAETTAIQDDEICRLGFVAVCELIEFGIPINEFLRTASAVDTEIELLISEIVISSFHSYLDRMFDSPSFRFWNAASRSMASQGRGISVMNSEPANIACRRL